MAYVTKELKTRVSAEIKKIMPKGTKYSIRGTGKGRLSLVIYTAGMDLLAPIQKQENRYAEMRGDKPQKLNHASIRHINGLTFGEKWDAIFGEIFDIMNKGNHDRSDSQVDYFDVGWYVSVDLGTWDRPFQHDMPGG